VPARRLCGSHLGRHDAGQPARLWFYSMAYAYSAPCAGSACMIASSRRPPAAPSVSSCSRSERSFVSASVASSHGVGLSGRPGVARSWALWPSPCQVCILGAEPGQRLHSALRHLGCAEASLLLRDFRKPREQPSSISSPSLPPLICEFKRAPHEPQQPCGKHCADRSRRLA
jgi:hypothetical protein